jgi:hypothetical protein
MKMKDLRRPDRLKEKSVIGSGTRGGYGVPLKKSKPTKYDGERIDHTVGLNHGSDVR